MDDLPKLTSRGRVADSWRAQHGSTDVPEGTHRGRGSMPKDQRRPTIRNLDLNYEGRRFESPTQARGRSVDSQPWNRAAQQRKWDEEAAKKLDADMAKKQGWTTSTKGDLSKGYDLVRWGNINDIAFFHCRDYIVGPVTQERLDLVKDITIVLKEMCEVFSYNAYYITLFYRLAGVCVRLCV